MTDTIFALATAPGRAAIAVVRLSGPAAGAAVTTLAGALPSPRRVSLQRLRDPETGGLIDEAVVLWMPGPASYTGEDSAELQLHGGPAVAAAAMAALRTLGLRLAEPGESTRRAFEAGRLDLAQAEAVADLVDAETEGQRAQALRQLGGELSGRYAAWRQTLVEILAHLEAAVDFPDEELPIDLADRMRPRIASLQADLQGALADAGRGERIREGFRVALIGAPNAGKSSLLNQLVGRDAAIVTPLPGTTRDVIEIPLVLAGYKILLADTAGVREAGDVIEAEGVRRARAWAESADLRVWVVDRTAEAADWREAVGLVRSGDVLVLNKSDLPSGSARDLAEAEARSLGLEVLELSATAPAAGSDLLERLEGRVVTAMAGGEFPAVTRERHRLRLEEALEHVVRSQASLADGAELAAEDLRLAARSLGRVAGRVDPETVLDVVFGSFCIGK
jgi:tRNA modification GTPase